MRENVSRYGGILVNRFVSEETTCLLRLEKLWWRSEYIRHNNTTGVKELFQSDLSCSTDVTCRTVANFNSSIVNPQSYLLNFHSPLLIFHLLVCLWSYGTTKLIKCRVPRNSATSKIIQFYSNLHCIRPTKSFTITTHGDRKLRLKQIAQFVGFIYLYRRKTEPVSPWRLRPSNNKC